MSYEDTTPDASGQAVGAQRAVPLQKIANFPPKPGEKHNGGGGAKPRNYQTKLVGGVNKGFFEFSTWEFTYELFENIGHFEGRRTIERRVKELHRPIWSFGHLSLAFAKPVLRRASEDGRSRLRETLRRSKSAERGE